MYGVIIRISSAEYLFNKQSRGKFRNLCKNIKKSKEKAE